MRSSSLRLSSEDSVALEQIGSSFGVLSADGRAFVLSLARRVEALEAPADKPAPKASKAPKAK